METTTPIEQLNPADSHFQMSASIGNLAKALALAQAEMKGAQKSSDNPFYKSKYADLAEIIEAAKPMHKHGLSITQFPIGGGDGKVQLVTLLMHESGEWIRGDFSMKPTKPDPQGEGSALTYARRYCYGAVAGVPAVDDDGNAASTAPAEKKPPQGKQVANGQIPAKPFRFDGKTASEVKTFEQECYVKVINKLGEFVLIAGDPISSKLLDLAVGSEIGCFASDTGQKKNGLPLFQIRKFPVEANEAPAVNQ